jgi:hypothetical protein
MAVTTQNSRSTVDTEALAQLTALFDSGQDSLELALENLIKSIKFGVHTGACKTSC